MITQMHARCRQIRALCGRIHADQQGATGIEYGLIASLIAMAIVGEVTTVGNEVGGYYEAMQTGLADANTPD